MMKHRHPSKKGKTPIARPSVAEQWRNAFDQFNQKKPDALAAMLISDAPLRREQRNALAEVIKPERGKGRRAPNQKLTRQQLDEVFMMAAVFGDYDKEAREYIAAHHRISSGQLRLDRAEWRKALCTDAARRFDVAYETVLKQFRKCVHSLRSPPIKIDAFEVLPD